MRQFSLKPTYESVSIPTLSLTAAQATLLKVQTNDTALRITAIGVANELPLAFYESFLTENLSSLLQESPPWKTEAAYQIAAAALQVSEIIANQEFGAVRMPRKFAQILKAPAGSPNFRSVATFSNQDTHIELCTALYPGGRYGFKASRHVKL